MNRPDLNILAKEVFEQNEAKGFHEVEYSNEELLMMVIIELSKAVEADSGGKRADLDKFYGYIGMKGDFQEDPTDSEYRGCYSHNIKGSIEDNLASAVVKLLDLAGFRGIDIVDTDSQNFCKYDYKEAPFTQSIFDIIASIYYNNKDEIPSIMIKRIEIMCDIMDISIWQHVELRMKYNQVK